MDFIQLIKDNWFLALIVFLIVIVIVVSVIKAAFRIAIFAVIVGIVLVVFFGFSPNDVMQKGKDLVAAGNNAYVQTVKPILDKEVQGAKITVSPDHSYVIQTQSIKITGTANSDKATVLFKGQTFRVNVSQLHQALQDQIKNATQNANAPN